MHTYRGDHMKEPTIKIEMTVTESTRLLDALQNYLHAEVVDWVPAAEVKETVETVIDKINHAQQEEALLIY